MMQDVLDLVMATRWPATFIVVALLLRQPIFAWRTWPRVVELRKKLLEAANYLEDAANVIADGADHDEDDEAAAREFIRELRREARK